MKVFIYGLIVGLLAGIVASLVITKPKPTKETIVKTVIVKGDSIAYEVAHYVPKYITKVYRLTDTIKLLTKIDTANILKDYFTKYFYCDTVNDSTILAIIKDTVSMNKITYRNVWFQNKRAQVVNYTTVETYPKIYIGAGLGTNGFSAAGSYLFNKRNMVSVNINPFSNNYSASYLINIR